MIKRVYFFFLSIILRVFFRLLYYELAWTYDWVAAAVSAGHWSEWVDQALPYLHGSRVLELGFGPGHLQAKIRAQGDSAFGVDRSWPMCRLAMSRSKDKNNSREHNGYAQLPNLVQAVGTCLPFKSAAFQSVLSTFPTEYIFHPATAAEIYRVLAPGGRLVIVLTAWITGQTLRERASALLFRITGQSEPWDDQRPTPFSQYGFSVQLSWIDLGHSRVCVLIADKA